MGYWIWIRDSIPPENSRPKYSLSESEAGDLASQSPSTRGSAGASHHRRLLRGYGREFLRPLAFVYALALGALLLLSTGCAALLLAGGAAAGAGAVAYVRGELKSIEMATLDKTWTATRGAMSDLEFKVSAQQKDALAAKLSARGAGDKKIQVDLKRLSDRETEIRIRVGTFGDEAISRQVLEKIKKRL